MSNETNTTIDDLAHEAWAAAQLAPGEGIDDAVRRIAGLMAAALDSQAQQIEALTAERDALRRRLDDARPAPGEWIEWAGGECPIADDARIDVKCRDGDVLRDYLPSNLYWSHHNYWGDIVAYRVMA